MRYSRSLVALALLTACDDSATPANVEVVAMRAAPNANIDLLVVLDNSASVLDLQSSLKLAFPSAIAILDTLDGGRPSLHIGVTSSDLGTTGSQDPDSPAPSIGSCQNLGDNGLLATSTQVQGNYIVDLADTNGTRVRNYAGTLADAFNATASIGSTGCEFEQPLRAIERAIANPSNAGFLRADANFATLIVVDEDDCSLLDAGLMSATDTELGPLRSFRCTSQGVSCDQDINTVGPKTNCHARHDSSYVADPATYATLLLHLKPDPRMVAASVIVGPPDVDVELRTPPGGGEPSPALAHSCPSGSVAADPAVRLAELVDDMQSPLSQVLSICDADLAPQLTAFGRSLKKLVGDPCIDTATLADTSSEPGVQPRCTAYDELAGNRTELAACTDSTSTDCFELVTDEAACPYVADHLRVRLRRSSTPSNDAWTYVRCAI